MLALVIGAAGAAGAGNHQIYSDTTGDAQAASSTAYASDIRQVEVTSADNGDTTIATTLADGPGHMSPGDELDVFFNKDRKASTGQNGFDYDLVATGGSSGPSFYLCTLSTPVDCQAGQSGYGSDQNVGSGLHVVTFNLTTKNIAAFDFFVVSSFPNPNDANNPLTDRAPNSGVITYSTGADGDHDGVFGSADKCPTVRVTRATDKNGNGCPGPFGFIRAFRRQVAVPQPGALQLRSLAFEGTFPSGTKVQLTGAGRGETLNSAAGYVRSRRFSGSSVSYGSTVTVQMTKVGWVGLYARYVATRGGGLVLRKQLCIPAYGPKRPVPCSNKLRGS